MLVLGNYIKRRNYHMCLESRKFAALYAFIPLSLQNHEGSSNFDRLRPIAISSNVSIWKVFESCLLKQYGDRVFANEWILNVFILYEPFRHFGSPKYLLWAQRTMFRIIHKQFAFWSPREYDTQTETENISAF